MYVARHVPWRPREYREGPDPVRVLVAAWLPCFPESGAQQHRSIWSMDEVRLFAAIVKLLPLEKPTHGDNATPLLESGTEHGFCVDSFAASVDRLEADLGVTGPARYQAPTKPFHLKAVVLVAAITAAVCDGAMLYCGSR